MIVHDHPRPTLPPDEACDSCQLRPPAQPVTIGGDVFVLCPECLRDLGTRHLRAVQ